MPEESEDQGDSITPKAEESTPKESTPATVAVDDDDEGEVESEAEESDDEEEEEPKLKYARLTSYLGPVYRNGDATSTFLVAGDKMVCLPGNMKTLYTDQLVVSWNS